MRVIAPLNKEIDGRGQPLNVHVDNFLWGKYVAATEKDVVHSAGELFFVQIPPLLCVLEVSHCLCIISCLCVVTKQVPHRPALNSSLL